MKKALSDYNTGIQVQTVKLMSVKPPLNVADSFNKVNQAEQQKEVSQNVARKDSTNTINWISNMKGSLLLIHGEDDDNVHAQNTSQFVDKAMKYGKDIDWIQYPGRNHGIYGNGSREHLYKKMIEFFKMKL